MTATTDDRGRPTITLPVEHVKTLLTAIALSEGLDAPNMNYSHVIDICATVEQAMKAAGYGTVIDWADAAKQAATWDAEIAAQAEAS